jgi:hypothetical protein
MIIRGLDVEETAGVFDSGHDGFPGWHFDGGCAGCMA